jgi:lactate dehydrogenase-like 2-hydroxyacid dehydrogenase
MKIVFLDDQTMGEVPNLELLRTLGDYSAYPITLPQERKDRIAGVEIIITCKVIIDKEMIDFCKTLRLICVAATGTNNVDVEYAHNKGIEVKNVTGYSSESVTQLTVGMLLSLTNKISYYDNYVKSGAYTQSPIFTHYGPIFSELKGKTAGIIGLGTIGSRVAEILEAFKMKVIYHSVSGNTKTSKYPSVSLNELLSTADAVLIHCPLTPSSRYIINKTNIPLLKSSSILINMARGGIVNETDMVEALNKNLIAGFATDVYEKEPMETNSPFLSLKSPEKVILTPHIAWISSEARILLIDGIIENIRSFIGQTDQLGSTNNKSKVN